MLSVVIPTLNAHSELARLLSQISAQVDAVVISDGGSTDDTLKAALSAKNHIALGCRGRGWQMARGARRAQWTSGQDQNDWLLFLHADTVMAHGWYKHVKTHITKFPHQAGVFKLKFDQRGFWPKYIEIWVALRCAIFALPYGDQGLLIRRDLYESTGGFADMDLFEDVDIIKRLGRKRIRTMPSAVITSGQRYRKNGYVHRGLSNVVLLLRYLFGAHPTTLSQKYNQ